MRGRRGQGEGRPPEGVGARAQVCDAAQELERVPLLLQRVVLATGKHAATPPHHAPHKPLAQPPATCASCRSNSAPAVVARRAARHQAPAPKQANERARCAMRARAAGAWTRGGGRERHAGREADLQSPTSCTSLAFSSYFWPLAGLSTTVPLTATAAPAPNHVPPHAAGPRQRARGMPCLASPRASPSLPCAVRRAPCAVRRAPAASAARPSCPPRPTAQHRMPPALRFQRGVRQRSRQAGRQAGAARHAAARQASL